MESKVFYVVEALANRSPVRLCFTTKDDAERFIRFVKLYRSLLGNAALTFSGYGVYWLYNFSTSKVPAVETQDKKYCFGLGLKMVEKMSKLISARSRRPYVADGYGKRSEGIYFYSYHPKTSIMGSQAA